MGFAADRLARPEWGQAGPWPPPQGHAFLGADLPKAEAAEEKRIFKRD